MSDPLVWDGRARYTVNRVCPVHNVPLLIDTFAMDLSCNWCWVDDPAETQTCDYSEPLPEDLRLRHEHAAELPW